MALIVETGSGSPSADTYVSLAEFDVFIADNAVGTAASDEKKEAVLREATRHHDGAYAWPIACLTSVQALRLPLNNPILTDDGRTWEGVPAKLKQAICLLATEALKGPLTVNQPVKRKVRSKTDVIESEYEFDPSERRRVFQAADDLIFELGGQKRSGGLRLGRT